MVLDLNALPLSDSAGGYAFSGHLDLSDVHLWGAFPLREPVEIDGRLSERTGILTLYLDVRYRISGDCGRCLSPASRGADFSASHIVTDRLPEEDADGKYAEAPGGRLDVGALVREDLLLDMPWELLCRDDCQGLCPKCGKNLNEGPCSCPKKEPDPRFDVLRKLINDQ